MFDVWPAGSTQAGAFLAGGMAGAAQAGAAAGASSGKPATLPAAGSKHPREQPSSGGGGGAAVAGPKRLWELRHRGSSQTIPGLGRHVAAAAEAASTEDQQQLQRLQQEVLLVLEQQQQRQRQRQRQRQPAQGEGTEPAAAVAAVSGFCGKAAMAPEPEAVQPSAAADAPDTWQDSAQALVPRNHEPARPQLVKPRGHSGSAMQQQLQQQALSTQLAAAAQLAGWQQQVAQAQAVMQQQHLLQQIRITALGQATPQLIVPQGPYGWAGTQPQLNAAWHAAVGPPLLGPFMFMPAAYEGVGPKSAPTAWPSD